MSGLNRKWSDDEMGRIEQSVRKAFSRDTRMSEATNLGVSFSGVRDKAIHVTGEVPDESVRDRALQIVSRNVPDGINVVDDMDMKS